MLLSEIQLKNKFDFTADRKLSKCLYNKI